MSFVFSSPLPFQPFSSPSLTTAVRCQPDVVVRMQQESLLTLDQSKALFISLAWLVAKVAVTLPIALTRWYLSLTITRSRCHFTVCPEINLLILQRWFRFQLAPLFSPDSPPSFQRPGVTLIIVCKKMMAADRESTTQTFILSPRCLVPDGAWAQQDFLSLNEFPLYSFVICCGFMHHLSNRYIWNHSVLLVSCRRIYGRALCVMGAGCRMWMTLACHLCALSWTLLSCSIVSAAKSL